MSIDELLLGIDIALGDAMLLECPAFDVNGDGLVTVDELLAGVDAALNDCTGQRPALLRQRTD